MAASRQGHCAVVQALINSGADVAKTDNIFVGTPLIIASHKGHDTVVQALLNVGAGVDNADVNGCTALSMASHKGHYTIVQALIDGGACVDNADSNGWTALIIASKKGHCSVVQTLINKGANVNYVNNKGSTALDVAINNKFVEVVKLLLYHGGRHPSSYMANWKDTASPEILQALVCPKDTRNVGAAMVALKGSKTTRNGETVHTYGNPSSGNRRHFNITELPCEPKSCIMKFLSQPDLRAES